MKIDFSRIVKSYLATIRGDRWTISSIFDFLIIFGVPIFLAYLSSYFHERLGLSFFLNAFTLFGVFLAVFITVQGVLVPLFHAPHRESKDETVNRRLMEQLAIRRKLIKEVSISMSYLKLVALFAMMICLGVLSTNTELFLFKWIIVAICSHLFLNILVALKRLNALFSYEFDRD